MSQPNVLNLDCKIYIMDASYEIDLETSEELDNPVFA
jgi:hypothetical protein